MYVSSSIPLNYLSAQIETKTVLLISLNPFLFLIQHDKGDSIFLSRSLLWSKISIASVLGQATSIRIPTEEKIRYESLVHFHWRIW